MALSTLLARLIACIGLLFILHGIVHAQNTNPLYEQAQQQAQYSMYRNSPDWDYMQELRELASLNPSLAPVYNQQINQLLQLYLLNNHNPAHDIIDQQNKNQIQATNQAMRDRTEEITKLLNEVHSSEPSSKVEYWQTAEFAKNEIPYLAALDKLESQLATNTLSIKDAYFEIENAYGNTLLTKKEYDDQIQKSANFITRWMIENKLDTRDNLSINFAIQKFMRDTLSVGKHLQELPDLIPETHLPFYYDYEDYKSEKDYRSYAVTKALATGNGQCHTLPLVYAILAEALGTTCYLSEAPIHQFIKYPDNNGNLHNFEVTSNWQISDQWYKDNLYVSSVAEKTKIYLYPLNKQQIIAGAIIDLACSYKQKLGVGDGQFITKCVDAAMTYFPNKDANIFGWLLREKVVAVKLNRILSQNNIKHINQAEQIPEAKDLVDKLNTLNAKIASLGYIEIPDEAYDYMIQHQDNIGKTEQGNNLQKRDLFIGTKTNIR